MNTRTDKILGASLALAAFSFITPSHVLAQTCVTPPTCDSLGFTKTTEDCVGKTILKCPFDLTKVYCPGADEQGDSPFVSTWEVGSSVMYNGKEIGIIFQDNGASVSVYSKEIGSQHACAYAKKICTNRTTYANMGSWNLPVGTTPARKIASLQGIPVIYINGECTDSGFDNLYYCTPSTCNASNLSDLPVVCVAEIPAPVNR